MPTQPPGRRDMSCCVGVRSPGSLGEGQAPAPQAVRVVWWVPAINATPSHGALSLPNAAPEERDNASTVTVLSLVMRKDHVRHVLGESPRTSVGDNCRSEERRVGKECRVGGKPRDE